MKMRSLGPRVIIGKHPKKTINVGPISSSALVWPSGADGALTISNGQTVTLSPGTSKDYSSISIALGGKLNVSQGNAWVSVGCLGSCVINGSIEHIQNNISNGTTAATAPDGTSLSYTTLVGTTGGNGGASNAGSGGVTVQNFAGGGAGDSPGNNGNTGTSRSGNGATGTGGSVTPLPGGTGGSYNQAGGIGTDAGPDSFAASFFWGSGGGGGGPGFHGGGLYLKFASGASGSGTITVAGQTGKNGGKGGDAGGAGFANYGGGGGGGGGGGNGGKIVIRYKISLGSITTSVIAGAGGSGGVGGSTSGGDDDINGSPGIGGTAGNAGSTDIATY